MSNNAFTVLKNDKMFGPIIKDVKVKISKTTPVKALISKILINEINEDDKNEITNYIWNLGFEMIGNYNFNYSNQLHVGIVLTLLTHYDNNPLSPFFPLQNYPEQCDRTDEITANWERELLKILNH